MTYILNQNKTHWTVLFGPDKLFDFNYYVHVLDFASTKTLLRINYCVASQLIGKSWMLVKNALVVSTSWISNAFVLQNIIYWDAWVCN